MIKAHFFKDSARVGTIKFEHDREGNPNDVGAIIAAAPKAWDVCSWDRGEIQAPRKERKPVETLETVAEITVSEDE